MRIVNSRNLTAIMKDGNEPCDLGNGLPEKVKFPIGILVRAGGTDPRFGD